MIQSDFSDNAAVIFDAVTVSIGGNTILDNVHASIPKGSCTAIVGPNGAGKTTMLLTLLGEIPFIGKINISCTDKKRKLRIGYVPQRLQFDRNMPLTVLEFMVMGWQRLPLWFGIRPVYKNKARDLLASVKIDKSENKRIGALSGGEMQKVLLALALGQQPDLLILDEPAAGVDFQGEYIFCELLESLRHKEGFTQLMVSHDLASVTHHATHVICLNRKVAAQGSPQRVLTPENLTAIFGLHMGLVNKNVIPNPVCTASCCQKNEPNKIKTKKQSCLN